MYTSPRTIRRGGAFVSVLGKLRTVRRFSVTSSPVTPSPRVAPRTNTPFSYSRDMERPSIFGSTLYSRSPSAEDTRSSKALSSSKENTSFRLSSGTSCVTGAKVLLAVPPTCCVGDFGS